MRTQREYLQDICDYADAILSFVEGVDFQTFQTDRKTSFAVIRAFEVIGEAVKNLDEAVKSKQPQVNWRGFAGFRDILSHAYHRVDPVYVWEAILHDLPAIQAAAGKLLNDPEVY